MSGFKIAVLGGSSPFTAALVDAFVDEGDRLAGFNLVFHGRSPSNLELLQRYAQRRLGKLGWHCSSSLRLAEVLDDVDIVVHQIRYGGLQRRAEGEDLCARLQLIADETFGPAALLNAIKTLPDLNATTAAIQRCCPNAWVLNLTNPLSSVTAAMCGLGVERCVGLCELPLITQQSALHQCRISSNKVCWTYSGFNHRGFIHTLEHDSQDCIAELARILGDQTFLGISADVIKQLKAIPLKHFRFVVDPLEVPLPRVRYLQALRDQIESELAESVARSPPGLRKRYLEWYPKSVVPMISALTDSRSSVQVVNVPRDDGLVVEVLADISANTIDLRPECTCSDAVQQWLDVFDRHEQSFLRAMYNPTYDNVLETLHLDPVVPDGQEESAARELWQIVSKGSEYHE